MQQLLVATRNSGKVAEFAHMLTDLRVEWVSLDDVGINIEVVEDGHTFRDNAWLKAIGYARRARLITLADDSGLEVDALNGDPGLHTARYGGPELSHRQRYEYLLRQLQDVPAAKRTARFRCIIAVANGAGEMLAEAEGICEGHIALEPRGSHGFGYDPIFLPAGQQGRTMAELEPAAKHRLSHRGQALAQLAPQLRQLLQA
jgi:XTP/dITP diphosphohydrolase